jgi:hypothetical protein
MSSEWFCKIMGEECGPMSSQELMAVAHGGRLTRDDLVRKNNKGTWVRAELVKGLFNNVPPAATATSDGVAVGSRAPLPAKRTVRDIPIRQYWVMVGNETAGPFSGAKLRKLAAKGKLKSHYLVSSDRKRWVPASQLERMLADEAAPSGPTTSLCSTIWPLPQFPDEPSPKETNPEVAASLVLSEAAR